MGQLLLGKLHIVIYKQLQYKKMLFLLYQEETETLRGKLLYLATNKFFS